MRHIRLITSIFCLLTISYSFAQTSDKEVPTAADFFYKAPIAIASELSEISRLDMIDYFNHGSSVMNENRLGAKVAIKSLSDEMIVWQDADSVEVALAVIPKAKADTVLIVIRTMQSPLTDSEITAYDKNWNRLDAKILPSPRLKDWMKAASRSDEEKVQRDLPFMLVAISYDPDDEELVYINRTGDYFFEKERPESLGLMKNELRYKWNGSSFKISEK